jgi:DNA transformation protein
MKKDSSYHDFVVYDLMSRLPDISSRPMMSGWSIYSDGVPFAAIIGNRLYMKATGKYAEKLLSLGWVRFSYEKKDNKTISMNYWEVPDELFDDNETLNELAEEAIVSAQAISGDRQ